MPHRRKHRLKLRSFYVWHRYVGITSVLFVLVLSVTGVLLNHTENFQFDSQHVQSDLILDWYGIHAPQKMLSYKAGEKRVTLFGNHLYLDTHELPGDHQKLVGAARVADFYVIAADQKIMLLTLKGTVVETLGGNDGVPSAMQSLGKDQQGGLVVDSAHTMHQPDADFLEWSHWDGDSAQIQWQKPAPLPENLYADLVKHYRGEILPVERVLLDLHSGRILGKYGVLVMDAAALLLIVLALTGGWMWFKRRR